MAVVLRIHRQQAVARRQRLLGVGHVLWEAWAGRTRGRRGTAGC